MYDPVIGRFVTADSVMPDLYDPQLINRYSYVRNNPLKYVDPDGHVLETAWDVANIAVGAYSLYSNIKAGNWGSAALDAGGIILDTAAAAVPILPGGAGTAIKAARAADKIADAVNVTNQSKKIANASKTTPQQLGRIKEKIALDKRNLPQNKSTKVSTNEGNSIPDSLTDDLSVEVKSGAQTVSANKQIRIQTDAAKKSNRTSVLVTGTKNKVTKPAQKRFDIIERDPDLD